MKFSIYGEALVKGNYCADVNRNTLALYLLGPCVYYDMSVFLKFSNAEWFYG